MYDVIIIGAGVIGAFIARELSKYNLKIALVEKESDIANGTTKANTAIIHAGYDAKPNSEMARLNVLGNKMFDNITSDLDVDFKRIGSLVLAFNDEDMIKIKELYDRGKDNGVPELTILSGEDIKKMEPNLNMDIKGGLYAPTCGIVDPWGLAIALCENAMENGVELYLNNKVKDITGEYGKYEVIAENQTFSTKCIVNCAGLYADEINDMVYTTRFEIQPRRGQYYILDKSSGNLVNSVIFQCPSNMGKGVVIAPTVHGNIIIGPDAENIDDKTALDTTTEGLNYVRDTALLSCGSIPFDRVITTFTGVRAEADTKDFIVGESKDRKGFINVAGIKSPGLSASPAIAKDVVDIIKKTIGDLQEKDHFNPKRKKVIRFHQLSRNEKEAIVKRNPAYGRVVCRCENITEGEILDCIRRKGGATTVDGVKKRVRPGSGRCQGGFCMPRVMEILSRELNTNLEVIRKNNKNSYILVGPTDKGFN